MIFASAWWSVELPQQWSGHPDGQCAAFRADPPLGVLQISAARKDAGPVTDQDLTEFAEERIAPEVPLDGVRFGAFSGVTAKYRKDGLLWQEWWLRSGPLMVYVTYNVVQEHEASEQDAIASILASLTNARGGSAG